MKPILLLLFVLSFSILSAQKLLLIDKKITLPLKYTNKFTTQDKIDGYFPIEYASRAKFIDEVEKVLKLLQTKTAKKPETYLVDAGATSFKGIRVPLAEEERMDIVMSTNVDGSKTTMHLCDAKLSNANNAFFITTWVKYIRDNMK
ncbi:MAG: hypothetical protein ABIR81_06065 [Ginsengibacter sp.]